MHPLTCVKYGAAALALGPAQSVTVPRGVASEYRIFVSIIISAYGTTLCAGPRPLYCMHYNCERSELSGLFNGTVFLYYCERSELSGLFNARIFYIIIIYIYIYNYVSGRTSCRKCSKCFYVYLNIRPMRYYTVQI